MYRQAGRQNIIARGNAADDAQIRRRDATRKRRKPLLLTAVLFCILLFGIVSSYRLTVSRYVVHTEKLRSPVRLLLIADLHNCYYGKNQARLIRAIEAQQPDVLLFCGDITDEKLPLENAVLVFDALASRYPSFYVTGNHEYWGGQAGAIKNAFRRAGATVLEGAHRPLSIRGAEIVVCGVDDPAGGAFRTQLDAAAAGVGSGSYTILLAHRPERIAAYAEKRFDLVLSGHAHGGLWRIPGLSRGFVAPNQGFFPQYTSGAYRVQDTAMIVSRGLARESTRIPRFFNTVELVVVDLLPAP